MEEMIETALIDGVIDYTISELTEARGPRAWRPPVERAFHK
jgi:hypothetical protein